MSRNTTLAARFYEARDLVTAYKKTELDLQDKARTFAMSAQMIRDYRCEAEAAMHELADQLGIPRENRP